MATKSSIKNTSSRPSSRKQVLFFLVGTLLLTLVIHIYLIREAKTVRTLAVVPLMWIPGLVGIACSNYFGNKFRDLGLNRPGRTSMLFAYCIPAACAVLTFAVLVWGDIGNFRWPESSIFKILLFQPTFGVLVNGILALGQELGWRGYLHTHLMRARIPEPMLVTGFIWAVWHWPLILFSDYSTSPLPWLGLLLFTIQIMSFSVILGWLREFSKSVFPCALAHAAHITWIQSIYPSFYNPGKLDPFFGGESGFILAITYMVIAIYLYRKHVAASNY